MFITGCHRSGTSLLASVLSEFLGVSPDKGDQMQPALDNPMGFQESNRFVSFNDLLLDRVGCSWLDHLCFTSVGQGSLLRSFVVNVGPFMNLPWKDFG